MAPRTSQDFSVIGQNIQYTRDGHKHIFVVEATPERVKNARLSASGKNKTVATTGGLAHVPGTDGMRINLTFSAPLDATKA